MRMWKLPPDWLCTNHLNGEHLENHMFEGCIALNKSLTGYIRGGLVELHNLKERHDELVEEMDRRGWNHRTPIRAQIPGSKLGRIDRDKSVLDLMDRCPKCRKKIKEKLRK